MGQKVNPVGLRLGINRGWDSVWYAKKKDFGNYLIEDYRIREFINEHSTWEFKKTVNSALNSTLSRTLNTSFTTLVVLVSMFILGADSLRGLLFALIIGVLVGTYSSVFVATPIMHDTTGKLKK